MLVQQTHVLVAQLLAVHLFDALGQQTAVQTDEALLRQLADQRSDVLVLYVRVRVKFRTLCCVTCLHIVHHEIQTLLGLTVLGVTLTIEDERFRHLIITLRHQRHLYLVLDLLYGLFVTYSEVRKNRTQCLFGSKSAYR